MYKFKSHIPTLMRNTKLIYGGQGDFRQDGNNMDAKIKAATLDLYGGDAIHVHSTRQGYWAFYTGRKETPFFVRPEDVQEETFHAIYRPHGMTGDIRGAFSGDYSKGNMGTLVEIADGLSANVLEQGWVSFPPRGLAPGNGATFGFLSG